ncbi:unnamed protein product [Notodromas monacha]|uniref:Uncharacterized protein n=1 Tax=Notodromas monacha TaxID=399045 RepID=A0A7R9BG28_9CRUS|nr:unnamed protein product [Notodromas monacha]CAG0913199.1 unnamed protein product [Notodromas monacha]
MRIRNGIGGDMCSPHLVRSAIIVMILTLIPFHAARMGGRRLLAVADEQDPEIEEVQVSETSARYFFVNQRCDVRKMAKRSDESTKQQISTRNAGSPVVIFQAKLGPHYSSRTTSIPPKKAPKYGYLSAALNETMKALIDTALLNTADDHTVRVVTRPTKRGAEFNVSQLDVLSRHKNKLKNELVSELDTVIHEAIDDVIGNMEKQELKSNSKAIGSGSRWTTKSYPIIEQTNTKLTASTTRFSASGETPDDVLTATSDEAESRKTSEAKTITAEVESRKSSEAKTITAPLVSRNFNNNRFTFMNINLPESHALTTSRINHSSPSYKVQESAVEKKRFLHGEPLHQRIAPWKSTPRITPRKWISRKIPLTTPKWRTVTLQTTPTTITRRGSKATLNIIKIPSTIVKKHTTHAIPRTKPVFRTLQSFTTRANRIPQDYDKCKMRLFRPKSGPPGVAIKIHKDPKMYATVDIIIPEKGITESAHRHNGPTWILCPNTDAGVPAGTTCGTLKRFETIQQTQVETKMKTTTTSTKTTSSDFKSTTRTTLVTTKPTPPRPRVFKTIRKYVTTQIPTTENQTRKVMSPWPHSADQSFFGLANNAPVGKEKSEVIWADVPKAVTEERYNEPGERRQFYSLNADDETQNILEPKEIGHQKQNLAKEWFHQAHPSRVTSTKEYGRGFTWNTEDDAETTSTRKQIANFTTTTIRPFYVPLKELPSFLPLPTANEDEPHSEFRKVHDVLIPLHVTSKLKRQSSEKDNRIIKARLIQYAAKKISAAQRNPNFPLPSLLKRHQSNPDPKKRSELRTTIQLASKEKNPRTRFQEIPLFRPMLKIKKPERKTEKELFGYKSRAGHFGLFGGGPRDQVTSADEESTIKKTSITKEKPNENTTSKSNPTPKSTTKSPNKKPTPLKTKLPYIGTLKMEKIPNIPTVIKPLTKSLRLLQGGNSGLMLNLKDLIPQANSNKPTKKPSGITRKIPQEKRTTKTTEEPITKTDNPTTPSSTIQPIRKSTPRPAVTKKMPDPIRTTAITVQKITTKTTPTSTIKTTKISKLPLPQTRSTTLNPREDLQAKSKSWLTLAPLPSVKEDHPLLRSQNSGQLPPTKQVTEASSIVLRATTKKKDEKTTQKRKTNPTTFAPQHPKSSRHGKGPTTEKYGLKIMFETRAAYQKRTLEQNKTAKINKQPGLPITQKTEWVASESIPTNNLEGTSFFIPEIRTFKRSHPRELKNSIFTKRSIEDSPSLMTILQMLKEIPSTKQITLNDAREFDTLQLTPVQVVTSISPGPSEDSFTSTRMIRQAVNYDDDTLDQPALERNYSRLVNPFKHRKRQQRPSRLQMRPRWKSKYLEYDENDWVVPRKMHPSNVRRNPFINRVLRHRMRTKHPTPYPSG